MRKLLADWNAASPDTRLKICVALFIGAATAVWTLYNFFIGINPPSTHREVAHEESSSGSASSTTSDEQSRTSEKPTRAGDVPQVIPSRSRESNGIAERTNANIERGAAPQTKVEKMGPSLEVEVGLNGPVLAVLLVDQGSKPLPHISQLIMNDIDGTTIFLGDFLVNSEAFDDALAGNSNVLVQYAAARQIDTVLLGKTLVQQGRDLQDGDLIVVNNTCEATLFVDKGWRSPVFIKATGKGVEYKIKKAEDEAQAMMIKDLVNKVGVLLKKKGSER